MTTRNLVKAVHEERIVDFEEQFQESMANRLMAMIAEKKKDVAKSVIKDPNEEDEEDDEERSKTDGDKSKKKDKDEDEDED